MTTYERILVGTDGSEGAQRAVAEAAELARAVGAELIVSSSYPRAEVDFALDQDSWHDTTAGQAEDVVVRGREIAAQMGVESRGLTAPASRPGPGLVETAEAEGADLVVVGNLGMTGTRRFMLGSVPDHVAHHAHCDVLVVHTHP